MTAGDLFSIAGARVLVTGGTAGIGRAVAEHFAGSGARVVIIGRRAEGQVIAERMGGDFVRADFSDNEQVARAFEAAAARLGAFDCVVLNAGSDLDAGSFAQLDMEAFRQVFEVNLFAVARALGELGRHVADGASVIVTSSVAGVVTGPGFIEYSASKAAVNMLVRSAALELGPRGVRVNAVLPGVVATAMNAADAPALATLTASGVVRAPEDLVGVFHFLASRASKTLTGAAIAADDGVSAGYSRALMERIFKTQDTPGRDP